MLDKMLAILRAISILDALQTKEGSYKLGEISRWAVVSRATTHRYLEKMVDWRLLEKEEGTFNGMPCRYFSITKDGRELLAVYQGKGYV